MRGCTRQAPGVGAGVGELNEEVVSGLLDRWSADADLRPLVSGAPDAVEVAERTDGKKILLFFLNHGADPATVTGAPQGMELLTETPVRGGKIALDPFGVAILHKD